MASRVTLSSLITAVQLRSDNHRLTSAQIITFINQAWTQLYDRLTNAYGEDYQLKQQSFMTSNTKSLYPLSYEVTLSAVSVAGFVSGMPVTFVTSANTATVRGVRTSASTGQTILDLSDLSFIPGATTGQPQVAEIIRDTLSSGAAASGTYLSNNGGIGCGDFYKIRGYDINYQGNLWMALKPYVWKDRNLYQNSNQYAGFIGPYYKYRLQGSNLVLTPTPNASQLLRSNYTPCAHQLVNLTDTIDAVNGWEEMIILEAARMCLINEEADTSQIERQIAEVNARIDQMAASRDSGEPSVVAACGMDYEGNAYLAATGIMGPGGGGWD